MASDGYNYETMAKKRMAVSALFLNKSGEILIVKPTYRSDWLLPGGLVEEYESPRKACAREIKEELNLLTSLTRLLCIEYHSKDSKQTESVQFVFYGGLLEEALLPSIMLQETELSEYRFAPREEAQLLLSCKLAKRLPYCLQALEENITLYLEDGKLPD
ncbi:MAG TPA: NUDIX hydrolase [Ktedonobacteraceae bacterium]|nr:NUDIX hydrolase [Ktedonobacteraceae bacterium]